MELNEYQKKAMETCMPSCDNISYMLLNLVGELGEFSSKLAKAIRKKQISIGWSEEDKAADESNIVPTCTWFEYEELIEGLKAEAGDIFWQLSGVCSVMEWKLEDIAQMNLEKLASRKERGKINGDGDNR